MSAAQQAVRLEASWLEVLGAEFGKHYMQELRAFLAAEKAAGKTLFPPGNEIFNAFEHTPLHSLKIVILGQDPYHGDGQAHGLCFSVRRGVTVPPSLKNIYKEVHADTGLPVPNHGDLTAWAERGVLLLNSVLTVERGQAASHRRRGWEQFTDRVIEVINARKQGVVFLLWGNDAQRKGAIIDESRHCVLQAPHPSPLSAHRGFLGCRHFSLANAWLTDHGIAPVDWELPE